MSDEKPESVVSAKCRTGSPEMHYWCREELSAASEAGLKGAPRCDCPCHGRARDK